jgi:hypothetical protein
LERMTYSMDDFVRRVFVDSLIGSWVDCPEEIFLNIYLSFVDTVCWWNIVLPHMFAKPCSPWQIKPFRERYESFIYPV